MDFDPSGKLSAGIHDISVEEFEKYFVDQFSTSQNRRPLFECLLTFIRELFQSGMPYEIWIDGSFATSKVNPNDIDVIAFLNVPQYLALKPLVDSIHLKYMPSLDLYFSPAVNDESQRILSPNDYSAVVNSRNYWRGQFGFDREDNPKGIIRISPESVKEYLDRR